MPCYTDTNISLITKSLSEERIATYANEHKDLKQALQLYSWNADICGALYVPLQGIEITLRNALHTALTETFGQKWYENNNMLTQEHSGKDIKKAKDILKRRNAEITPPNVISELSFGFWVSLLAGKYHDTLWTPALHRAFPNAIKKKRKDIFTTLNHLRKLRNRIAHHEPIFKRHLDADYKNIIQAIAWICMETASWTDSNNSFIDILRRRPSFRNAAVLLRRA